MKQKKNTVEIHVQIYEGVFQNSLATIYLHRTTGLKLSTLIIYIITSTKITMLTNFETVIMAKIIIIIGIYKFWKSINTAVTGLVATGMIRSLTLTELCIYKDHYH